MGPSMRTMNSPSGGQNSTSVALVISMFSPYRVSYSSLRPASSGSTSAPLNRTRRISTTQILTYGRQRRMFLVAGRRAARTRPAERPLAGGTAAPLVS
jgi:hypothetical protein